MRRAHLPWPLGHHQRVSALTLCVRERHGNSGPAQPPGGSHSNTSSSRSSVFGKPSDTDELRSNLRKDTNSLISGPRRHQPPPAAAARRSSDGSVKETWTLSGSVGAKRAASDVSLAGQSFGSGLEAGGSMLSSTFGGSQRHMPMNPQMLLKKEIPAPTRRHDPLKGMSRDKRLAAKDPRTLNVPEETVKKLVDHELSKADRTGIKWTFLRLNWRVFRNVSVAKVQNMHSRLMVIMIVFAVILLVGLFLTWYSIMVQLKGLPADYRRDFHQLMIKKGCRWGDVVGLARKIYNENPDRFETTTVREALMILIDTIRSEGWMERNWFFDNRHRYPALLEGDIVHFMVWMALYFGVFITGGGEYMDSTRILIFGIDLTRPYEPRKDSLPVATEFD